MSAPPRSSTQRTAPSATAVHELVRRLPAGEREAVTLARAEHLTYRDVAVALGIPEGTAKQRIRSGLRRLRAEMQRTGMAAH